MDILDKLDDENINELFKKVIRKGVLKRKLICPLATQKAQGGKCVMMSPSERRKRKKATKLVGKKISANIGIQKQAQRKRAKSLRKRAMRIPGQGGAGVKFDDQQKENTILTSIGKLIGE